MDQRFGSEFTVGLEEELLLVDGETRRLAPVAERVLPATGLPDGAAGHEAYAAEIELRSPPCATAPDAVAALGDARAAARRAAEGAGAALMGAGLHPAGELGDAPLVALDRYRRVDAAMRGLIRRTPECALHVHVGMPDADAAVRACNGLREHLPLLEALAANSPWWFGVDSGFASARYPLVQAFPGRGIPPFYDGFDDYERQTAEALDAGGLDDYTLLWWDVRVHPRLGTVEVREMDVQAPLRDAAPLAALVQALARHEAERAHPKHSSREAIAWSSFLAARDGLDATVLYRGERRPMREVAAATVAETRSAARELGVEDAVAEVDRLVGGGGGASRQRAAYERGGLDAMLELLVEETAAPLR